MKPDIKLTRNAQGHEQRVLGGSMELRAEPEFCISGLAAPYNTRSAPIAGQFVEVIGPGCFDDSMRSDDIVCAYNHDESQLLGRKSSGTLTLTSTPAGLGFRCQLSRSNPVHCAVYDSIQRGDLRGCSFAFVVPDGGDDWTNEGRTIVRTVRKAKLFELGPVVRPAYDATNVDARSADYVRYSADKWRELAKAKLAQLDDDYRRTLCDHIGHEIAKDK